MYTTHPVFECIKSASIRHPKHRSLWRHVTDDNLFKHVDRLGDFDHRFRANLFRKVSDFPGGNPEENAWQAFLDTEARTKVFNSLLPNAPRKVQRYINLVAYFLNEIFGGMNYEDVIPRITYGAAHGFMRGGDFLEVVSSRASFYSPKLYEFHKQKGIDDVFIDRMSTFLTEEGEIVIDTSTIGTKPIDEAQVSIVPKKWNMGRLTMKTSHHKRAYQNGIGDWMTRRLKERLDIDLSTAPSIHKDITKYASITGEWATIDLSSASDTIGAFWIDKAPNNCAEYMHATRDDQFRLGHDGALHEMHAAAGQGCGWTFPFETALFWSICASTYCIEGGYEPDVKTLRNIIKVYGDDILVLQDMGTHVLRSLELLGFIPNKEKSFVFGPFRESCGEDSFNGNSVRPYYAKSLPQDLPSWYSFINGIYRCCYLDNGNTWRGDFYHDLWLRLIKAVPGEVLFGPSHLGDSVINCDDPFSEFGEDVYRYRRRGRMILGLSVVNTSDKESVYHKARRLRVPNPLRLLAFSSRSLAGTSGTTSARVGNLSDKLRLIPTDRNITSVVKKTLSLRNPSFEEGDVKSLFHELAKSKVAVCATLSSSDIRMLRAEDVYERHQAVVGPNGLIATLKSILDQRVNEERLRMEKDRSIQESVYALWGNP